MSTRKQHPVYSLQAYNRRPDIILTDPLNPWGSHPIFQRRRKVIIIPQDIIDEIFDFLRSDFISLKAASLVCHSWVHPCRLQLFRMVRFEWAEKRYLYRPAHKPELKYEKIVVHKLTPFIREVVVTLEDNRKAHKKMDRLKDFPGTLTNLEILTVKVQLQYDEAYAQFGPAVQRIPLIVGLESAVPVSLRRVVVRLTAPMSGEPYIQLLVPLAVFRPQQGKGKRKQNGGDETSSGSPRTYYLEDIQCNATSTLTILNQILAIRKPGPIVSMDRLRSISLQLQDATDFGTVNSILGLCGYGSVERLELSISPGYESRDEEILILELHLLPHLRTLSIKGISPAFPPNALIGSFLQFKSTSPLRSIKLEFHITHHNIPTSPPTLPSLTTDESTDNPAPHQRSLDTVSSDLWHKWAQLDQALSGQPFMSLRDVEVTLQAVLGPGLGDGDAHCSTSGIFPILSTKSDVRITTGFKTKMRRCCSLGQ